jgi:hypothetical protein
MEGLKSSYLPTHKRQQQAHQYHDLIKSLLSITYPQLTLVPISYVILQRPQVGAAYVKVRRKEAHQALWQLNETQ